jgi:hypothetical protein
MISPCELIERPTGDDLPFGTLEFASCLAYSPSGAGVRCGEGRLLRARLKSADARFLARAAAIVWREWRSGGRFREFFGPGVVLIPVPGSHPVPQGPWVGERLAWCLSELDLAQAVWPVLRRRRAVRKSAVAPAGQRPSVLEHYRSLAVDAAATYRGSRADSRPLRLVLIDDVVTRGRTLLAAAARLRQALPGCEVRAFALLRTLDRLERVRRLVEPLEGEVRWLSGDARRRP